jgi:hypothetical protein
MVPSVLVVISRAGANIIATVDRVGGPSSAQGFIPAAIDLTASWIRRPRSGIRA